MTLFERLAALTKSRQRKLALLVGAVALPALILAGFATLLTLRVAREVEAESARYCGYVEGRVTEAFEQELVAQLRDAVVPAEGVAREGGDRSALMAALASRSRQFEAPHYVPVEDMAGLSVIMVESNMLLYGDDPTGRHQHPFAAVVLRGPDGDVTGAGGWWFNPRAFVATRLASVVRDRLTSSPRMYGGIESTRYLSVQVVDPQGNEVGRVRDPARPPASHGVEMTGPFEGYRVRVTPTAQAPVSLAGRFVIVEVSLIALLTLVMLGATTIGVHYILRQIELVQVKSSFVSNVTHELKTPIAVIKLAVETLEMRRFRTPEEGDKYLRTILRESDRLAQLVDNILDFSRLESGQKTLRLVAVSVADVVAVTMESFRLRLEDGGFDFRIDIPESLPRVRGDSIALQHCLLNLLDNAMKYSKERKEVLLSARERDGMVSISVADRGIGIGPEDQKRIFEKFARVETGLVHTVKGAGLGLSLVEQLIRAHHGRVEVASTPGEGSIFTLLIPIWTEEKSSPRA